MSSSATSSIAQHPALVAADKIMRWWLARPLAAVQADLDRLGDDHPVLQAASTIAAAANSTSDSDRASGLRALFAGLVEPLADSFTPSGRALYHRVFCRVVWQSLVDQGARPALAEAGITSEAELYLHASAARQPRRLAISAPQRIAILSRVTLGADVAITNLAVQRLRQRWPKAELLLLGDAKLAGLFGGLDGLRVVPVSYPRRGPLGERLLGWRAVAQTIAAEKIELVINPDSRLDQQGILPICPLERYHLWEGLHAEGQPAESLGLLFDRWLCALLGLEPSPAALPTLWPDHFTRRTQGVMSSALGGGARVVAVKFDHGGNPAKSLPREAELAILAALAARGWRVLLDRGWGADELAASDTLLAAWGKQPIDLDETGQGLGVEPSSLAPGALADAAVIRFHGSIGGWCGCLGAAHLAFSYDSVGHHLAAALGVPAVVAFTGHPHAGFPTAWQPRGRSMVNTVVIPTEARSDRAQWQRVFDALPGASASAQP